MPPQTPPQTHPTVHALFLAALERYPDRTFLHYLTDRGEVSATYREAAGTIAHTVELLQADGAEPGDRAVCYAEEIVPSIYFMVACAFSGVAFAPLGTNFSTATAARFMERTRSRFIFTTGERAPAVRELGLNPICPSEGAPRDQSSDADLHLLRAGSKRGSAEDTYIILSTSGTTGEPKLPVRKHLAVTYPMVCARDALRLSIERPERVLLCSGLTHGLGQAFFVLGLLIGAELRIPEKIEAEVSLEQIQRLDPTLAFVHPRIVRSLHRQHVAAGGDPKARFFGPSLSLLRTGGAHLEVETQQLLADQGIDIGVFYASSETGTIAITERGAWKPDCVGKIFPGVQVKVAQDGELLIRSPARMSGYFGDDAQTAEALADDGFLRSGDLGEVTAEGELRLLGRKREVLNAPDGTNIYAPRIEDLIEALPWVHQAVVVGDQQPFVGALIAIEGAVESTETDGYLPPESNAELYRRAHAALAELSSALEAVERVRGVRLFAKPFGAQHYAGVGMGKVRRSRSEINSAYAKRIDSMYRGE